MKSAGSKIVMVVVLIAVVLGVKTCKKAQFSSELKSKIEQTGFLSNIPGVDETYGKVLLDYGHPEAVDAAYHMGGRRAGAKFDENVYRRELYKFMAEKARQDGKNDVASMLRLQSQY